MALGTISIAGVLAVAVIFSDLYARRVPNKALLVALCFGAVVVSLQVDAASHAVQAITGLALGLAALLPFYLLGWMGAGDVKFFAVLGFLLGASSLLPIWLCSMVILTIHGIAQYAWRRTALWRGAVMMANFPGSALCMQQASGRLHERFVQAQGKRKGMPYAAHLSASALIWLAWGNVL